MVSGHTTTGGLVRPAPKNHRSKVALKKVIPKRIENPKVALFLKGEKCSQVVQDVMTDLCMLKKPYVVKMTKKNEFRPFEDAKHLEFLAFKNDASLFAFGSHNKKKPHNLTIGRHFDYQLLDMLELGVNKYETMKGNTPIAFGSKPLMLFHGELFDTNPTLGRIKNVLLDFFRGRVVEQFQLAGIDHCIAITLKPKDVSKEITVSEDGTTVTNASILLRHYTVALKKSGNKVPKTELSLVGPTIDFDVRRCLFATPQMMKHACRLPKGVIPKNEKNISTDVLGNKTGQLHVGEQSKELATMGTRKFKAFRKQKPTEDEKAAAAVATNAKRKSDRISAAAGDEVGPLVMPKAKRKKVAAN